MAQMGRPGLSPAGKRARGQRRAGWLTASALNSGLNARRFLDIHHIRPSNIEGSEVSTKSRQAHAYRRSVLGSW